MANLQQFQVIEVREPWERYLARQRERKSIVNTVVQWQIKHKSGCIFKSVSKNLENKKHTQAGRLAGWLAGWQTDRQTDRQTNSKLKPPIKLIEFCPCNTIVYHNVH